MSVSYGLQVWRRVRRKAGYYPKPGDPAGWGPMKREFMYRVKKVAPRRKLSVRFLTKRRAEVAAQIYSKLLGRPVRAVGFQCPDCGDKFCH
jgi:hypothetical protein